MYQFNTRFGNGGPFSGMCDNPLLLAECISFAPLGPAITLCPQVFGRRSDNPHVGQDDPFRHLHPVNTDNPKLPKYSRLDEFNPSGGVLFHELLHLLFGPARTRIPIDNAPPGRNYEEYNLIEMLLMPVRKAMLNPQSYTLAAHAYSLTNFYRSLNQVTFEWPTGLWEETLGD